MDWIDEEKKRRDSGHKRPLLQTEHWAMNARYPGETLEFCCDCNQPTGCAGKAEDSNYTEDDEGPFCWECWERLGHNAVDANVRTQEVATMQLREGEVAFVMAQIALMNCERAGMEAENTHRLSCGHSIAYGEESFQALHDKYAPMIGSNALLEMARS